MTDFDSHEDLRRWDAALWTMIEEGVPEDIIVGKIWDRLGDDADQLDALMEQLRVFHHNMLEDARIPAWEDEAVYGAQRAYGARLAPLVGRVIAALVQRMNAGSR
jgi:hypothetical protein